MGAGSGKRDGGESEIASCDFWRLNFDHIKLYNMADPRGVASTIVVPSEDPKQEDKKAEEPEHAAEKEANDAALSEAKAEINKELDELVRVAASLRYRS